MKISIVTVAHNSSSTIRDTIESVLNQTYADIEYIIVDGLSIDQTVPIIVEYHSRFNGRMRWISEKDDGIYDAMNKGIRMATGDLVGILNSDDFYHKTSIISTIADAFGNSLTQAAFADVRYVEPNNLEKTVRYYSSKKFTPNLFRFGFMPAHPTFFTYRKYYEAFGYYNTSYSIAADYELLIRFLYKNKLKYQYLPVDMLKMRTGGVSTTSWRSNYVLNREIVRACSENRIYTNIYILLLKYFIKVFEFIWTKN